MYHFFVNHEYFSQSIRILIFCLNREKILVGITMDKTMIQHHQVVAMPTEHVVQEKLLCWQTMKDAESELLTIQTLEG